jgi:cell division protein FtsB
MSVLSASLGQLAPAPLAGAQDTGASDDDGGQREARGRGGGGVPRASSGRARPHRDGSRTPLRRLHLVAVVAAISIVLVLMVFARALSEASAVNERAARMRAENAVLQEQLTARQHEVQLIQGDAFLRVQARAYGLGEPGERVFGLPVDAPAPPSIIPLGAAPAEGRPTSPLDAWLELLFGP